MELTLKDETAAGDILNEIRIQIESERILVKDLIASRVTVEVDQYNHVLPEYFKGLVRPQNAEKSGKGYKLKKKQIIDREKQVYIALEAFMNNGFFLLINDRQVTNLDEEVLVSADTSVSFVKLTPLVGG